MKAVFHADSSINADEFWEMGRADFSGVRRAIRSLVSREVIAALKDAAANADPIAMPDMPAADGKWGVWVSYFALGELVIPLEGILRSATDYVADSAAGSDAESLKSLLQQALQRLERRTDNGEGSGSDG